MLQAVWVAGAGAEVGVVGIVAAAMQLLKLRWVSEDR